MIDFKKTYSRDEILDFLKNSFLKDFQKDVRTVDVPDPKYIEEAYSLGYSSELELAVFEFLHEGSTEKRVTLTKEAFNVLRDSGSFKAIGIFHSKDTDDWRFSLMTATPVVNEKGKVKTVLSNPKRYSFLLGPNAKVNTPTKFLITKGEIQNFEDLKERFSIEVVNKEFYKEISKLFIQLVGGTLGKGKSKEEYKALLRLPGVKDSSQTAQEFAVRLIGRLIFCWFLREKKNGSEESLMPHSLLSFDASKNYKNYYHDVLEPIFFKVLNVPLTSRKDEKFSSDPYDKIPYLNGGLFSPHDDDFYSNNESKQEDNNKEVVVPDKWLQELFEILETYNFTIDENSAFDEELSIDPEMLGRIFENLLAEINPETGESARKSTGSYYTPRVIVDYMVDESLYLYLKNKTDIEEEKLRSLISYDLDDDTYTPLTEGEKEKIISAIDELKILDPACGSGAFPMGALQKIVFILQQLDPNGQYWFKAQIKNVPVELRKNLEREHSEKNFDYIRKLGVIRRNIFGVDIQPIATEISRLRCFLTLIVDQKVDDTKDNRGIDPLPNLDFKFVTANSLISLPEKENPKETIGMFEDSIRINELKDIRDQFFNASNFERIELKDQFRKIQLEMSKYYNSVKSAGAELTEMLLSWDPFSHKTTEWFDPEWMFGIKEGFDMVIGNPPYIDSESMVKNDMEDLREYIRSNYKYTKGNWDMYIAFFERGFQVLSSTGTLTFITPDKWISKSFGLALRERKYKKLVSILNAGRDIFASAKVDSIISVFNNSNINEYISVFQFEDEGIKHTRDYKISKLNHPYALDYIFSGHIDLLEKLEGFVPSEQEYLCENACATSDAYKLKDLLIDLDEEYSEEYLKIINTGTIDKWTSKWGEKEMTYLGDKYLRPVVSREKFVKLFRNSYSEKSIKQKIILKGLNLLDACLDIKGCIIPGKSTLIITAKDIFYLKFIMAILNSPITFFYLRERYPSSSYNQGTTFTKDMINNLPLPRISKEEEKEVVFLVDEILRVKNLSLKEGKISELEEDLNDIIMGGFELTEDQTKRILDSI